MADYEFTTSRGDHFTSRIVRHDVRPSGLIVPTELGQIMYADTSPVVSSGDIHIPTEEEVLLFGQPDQGTSSPDAQIIEHYSFQETDLRSFGKKATEMCVTLIQEQDTDRIALFANATVMAPHETEVMKQLSQELQQYVVRRNQSGGTTTPSTEVDTTSTHQKPERIGFYL